MDNPYQTLEVERTATEMEIRLSYRKLSRRYHPDRNPGEEAAEMMARINVAYGIIGDPDKRAHYDQTGQAKASDPERMAQERLMFCIQSSLEKFNPGHRRPLTAIVRGELDSQIASIRQNKSGCEKNITNLTRVKDKIAKGEGPNAFHMIADQRIDGLRNAMAKMDADISQAERARAMLDEYQEAAWEEMASIIGSGSVYIQTGAQSQWKTG